jgi:nucleotide-binding universal stress UspA family protein
MKTQGDRHLKSLLVALDETPASDACMHHAVSLARVAGASLTGVGIVDVEYLTAPEPRGIGTAHLKARADRARLQRARERNQQLAEQFTELCRAAGVSGSVLHLEGSPAAEICSIADAHDLIVIGRDCDFRGEPSEAAAESIERLLKDNPRPLLVTPETARDLAPVIVAYDGSVAAARALQLFVLLCLADHARIRIVSVDASQEEADRHAQRAAAYIGLHGASCEPRPVASSASPADVVCDEARSLGAGLVVMGAYGRRGWREALLGSFTTRLLAQCPAALFIHH